MRLETWGLCVALGGDSPDAVQVGYNAALEQIPQDITSETLEGAWSAAEPD